VVENERISVEYACGCKASGAPIEVALVCPKHQAEPKSKWPGLIDIKQPDHSVCCGQVCVAMVLGISLEESLEIFGHAEATFAQEIAGILRLARIDCRPMDTGLGWPALPNRAMLHVRMEREGQIVPNFAHWVVLWDGTIYDPAPDEWFAKAWATRLGAKIDGYIEIRGRTHGLSTYP